MPAYLAKMDRGGIRGFVLGGVDPDEWSRQLQLRDRFPGRFWSAFGLHPYFVANSDNPVLQKAFLQWEKLLPAAALAGEMGLDFRRPYLASGPKHQEIWFERQMAVAQRMNKPIVLHIVRAHEPAIQILRKFAPLKGMVHAFNSSRENARRYLELGLHLSIGAAILFDKAEPLREAVRTAPLERLLIESDAPDQPPPGQEIHDSSTIWRIASRIADIHQKPRNEIISRTRQNLADLVGISI